MQPEAGLELAIGGALRMQAMRRYNQYLALRLGVKPNSCKKAPLTQKLLEPAIAQLPATAIQP
ncbi:hypothetical protein CK516_37105 [Nostoc sp. 'Peltigera malacea cyanobiont' DB3992]|nr:hypothetical protein CK516_37105 [Nostoc sp. 'Peltigera malacea cyanobiont' DB3992]